MTFDPLKFYEDGQRKQKRYDSLLPVFLVAVVLLAAFYGFFVVYQRSHWKPKPAAAVPVVKANNDCVRHGDGWECGNASTVWLFCNAGMEVTDLRDCPEYISAYRAGQINAIEVIRAIRTRQPRKHKRKMATLSGTGDYLTFAGSGYLTSTGIIVGTGVTISDRIESTPQPITKMEPVTQPVLRCPEGWHVEVWHKGYCPNCGGFSVPQYPDTFQGRPSRYERYSVPVALTASNNDSDFEHPAKCIKDDSKPEDITGLMEQISPTMNADIKLPPNVGRCSDGTLTTGECPKPKPDCKMPADIDVCPIQMLDPKGADDKKGKP